MLVKNKIEAYYEAMNKKLRLALLVLFFVCAGLVIYHFDLVQNLKDFLKPGGCTCSWPF